MRQTKLHETLAVEKGVKSRVQRELTELNKQAQKVDLFNGLSRTYAPLHEDGETRPAESKIIQSTADTIIRGVSKAFIELMDITVNKDVANQGARADLIVDGETILKDVPVLSLLAMEKSLTDVETVIRNLPTLDPSIEWKYDTARACYVSSFPVITNSTKKVPVSTITAPATDKHQALVQTDYEDKVIGKYEALRFSSALTVTDRDRFLSRVIKIKSEVKAARQRANDQTVSNAKHAQPIIDFIFG